MLKNIYEKKLSEPEYSSRGLTEIHSSNYHFINYFRLIFEFSAEFRIFNIFIFYFHLLGYTELCVQHTLCVVFTESVSHLALKLLSLMDKRVSLFPNGWLGRLLPKRFIFGPLIAGFFRKWQHRISVHAPMYGDRRFIIPFKSNGSCFS